MKTKCPMQWKKYTCRECGKKFDVMNGIGWAYAIGNPHQKRKMFCSWHCIQGYRRAHEKRRVDAG